MLTEIDLKEMEDIVNEDTTNEQDEDAIIKRGINDEKVLDSFMEHLKNRLLEEKMAELALKKRKQETQEMADLYYTKILANDGKEAGVLAKNIISFVRADAELQPFNSVGKTETTKSSKRLRNK